MKKCRDKDTRVRATPKALFSLYSKTFGLTVLLSHNDIGGDLKLLETKEVYSLRPPFSPPQEIDI